MEILDAFTPSLDVKEMPGSSLDLASAPEVENGCQHKENFHPASGLHPSSPRKLEPSLFILSIILLTRAT